MEPLYRSAASQPSEKVLFSITSNRSDLEEIGQLRAKVWQSEGIYVPDFAGSAPDCWPTSGPT